MSERVNTSRYQQKVRARFGTKGDNPVPSINELVPVVVIELPRPEDDFVGGDDFTWTTFATTGPVAAETSHVYVFNPPDSNVLQIIEYAGFAPLAGNVGAFFLSRVDPATIAGFLNSSLLSRDVRAPRPPGFGGTIAMQQWRGDLTAAEVTALAATIVRLPTATIPWDPSEVWVIPPGVGFGFTANVVNLQIQGMFSGRQHNLTAGIRS